MEKANSEYNHTRRLLSNGARVHQLGTLHDPKRVILVVDMDLVRSLHRWKVPRLLNGSEEGMLTSRWWDGGDGGMLWFCHGCC